MNGGEEIMRGSLVIVVDRERTLPLLCWGLVIKKLPGGSCEVQIGENKKENILVMPENLVFILQTEGKFDTPKVALDYYRDQILLQNTLVTLTSRDFRALQRYKHLIERRVRRRFWKGIEWLLHRVPKDQKPK